MRISDWSSDVCASDLGAACVVLRLSTPIGDYRCGFGGAGRRSTLGSKNRPDGPHRRARENSPRSRLRSARAGRSTVSIRRPDTRSKRSPVGRAHRVYVRSEEHTSELQSLMRISYAVFCLKKKNNIKHTSNKQSENHKTIHD